MNTLPTTIILASNNQGKLREFTTLFAQTPFTIVPQGEFNVEDAIEDGLSFVENAIIKARHASSITQMPAIADDSGLEIDALDGKPGIYSARYSGEHGNDQQHNQLVLEQLAGLPYEQRSARFQCVLAFMRHANDPSPLVCQASWEGYIAEKVQGDNGFGYDPLFWLPTEQCTSAELPKAKKNAISHRAKALQLLLTALQQQFSL